MRERNHQSLRLNLTLDSKANDALQELQRKMGIKTTSELIRRAINAYDMLVQLNEEKAQIKHSDGSVERLSGLL